MTREEFQSVWRTAEGITPASLAQPTVSMGDVETVLNQTQEKAPPAVRLLLARAVAAGRPVFVEWFADFYKTGGYPDERAGNRPVLAGMIRRLLSGALAPGDHPSLAYAKELIDAETDAWRTVGERFEQRNP